MKYFMILLLFLFYYNTYASNMYYNCLLLDKQYKI